MKPLIFSVEDDINIQYVIKIAMQNSQLEIECFNNAKDLFRKLDETVPDLFLLDIMLPDMSGLDIIRKLKKIERYKQIPIMIISAKTSEIDRVIGIDLGADDYMIKPFGVLELIARVKALLRRSDNNIEDNTLEINGLLLNISEHIVTYNGNQIILTKKQFDLLKYFMERNTKLLTREELVNNIWGYDFIGESRTLDVHIKEIRRKLKIAGVDEEIIQNIRGVGYKLVL
jgi:two-component system alkaline phosphatase synthesis response regulator PhoP